MSASEEVAARTVVLSADDEPFAVVFEMLGDVVVVPPFKSLRLLVRGAPDAELTIGYGRSGVSVFKDEDLEVEIYDQAGRRLDVAGW